MNKTRTRPITEPITEGTARRVLEVVDAGLVSGLGDPVPGQMCVEAAICYALGLPHGDDPDCVIEAGRRYKIALNDADWSSDKARAKGLRRAAVAQLGSKGVVDESKWLAYVVEQTIRRIVPMALRAAVSVNPDEAQRHALEAAAVRCEEKGTKAALTAAYAAYAADAAAYAARAAAAADAAGAAAAAAYAARAGAAADAAGAAYAAARAAAESDSVLAVAAEIAVEAFAACGSPGAAWLTLCPPECEEAGNA